MKKIIFLDICGTLYNSNTTFDFLNFYKNKNLKYRIYKCIKNILIVKIINKIIYKLKKRDYLREIATYFLKNESEINLEIHTEKFYNSFLLDRKKEKIILLLEKLKKDNYEIILLSGTYDFIAKKIAEKIGAQLYYGTKLEKKENFYTGKIKMDLLISKEKVVKQIKLNEVDNNFILITDNKTDANLIKYMKKSFIVITKENKRFWLKYKKYNNGDEVVLIEE